VLDDRLRIVKNRVLRPIAVAATAVPPIVLTVCSLMCCVSAGLAAWQQLTILSVALWLIGRLLDGLDGPVARLTNTASDLGGYLDLMADVVGYAAVPLGLAAGQASVKSWTWCAVLIATFYVNTMSWTLLSALFDRSSGERSESEGSVNNGFDRSSGERSESTFHMPTALVEGFETIVLFTIMLAVPSKSHLVFALMAAGVTISIVQRVVWALRNLGPLQS
jgi:phosphatidylglycerophosphate synthase